MRDDRSRPTSRRRTGKKKKASQSRGNTRLLWIGWGFLAAVLVLTVAVGMRLLSGATDPGPVTPTIDPGPAGSAFGGTGDKTLTTDEGGGGRKVRIDGVDCPFEEPGEITFGRLENVDLAALAERVTANLAEAGWGRTVWSGYILRAADPAVMTGADRDKQAAFLKTDKPEAFARTFLENSGLIPMLREYGLNLTTDAENNNGEIIFRGTSAAPGGECSVRLTFLYTGAFSQALIRATYLPDDVTTGEVVPLSKAVKNAVTWTAGNGESTRVTAAELRHIRGIPFYVLDCADGTTAYSLAINESALDAVPGAETVYRELLRMGIQDNIVIPGSE